nr:hypothetical protein [Tanacetum cinerariifolium]
MYYPRFTKVIIHHFINNDKTVSKRNKIGMQTSRYDSLINTLRFVSAKEESQIFRARIPKSMTSLRCENPKLTRLILAMLQELYLYSRHESSRNMLLPNSLMSQFHLKNLRGSQRELRDQQREVRKKSLRDFHKTHPSGSGTATKIAPSAAKIKPSVTNKETSAKPGVTVVIEEESIKNEAKSWGRDEDDRNNDHESSNEGSDRESDSGDDNTQSDNEKGLDSGQETDENETTFKSNHEENKEENEDK